MPKLPDYRDVGDAPSGRSGRVGVRASDADGSAIGKGLQRAGQVVSAVGEMALKKRDTEEALEADARWQKLMNEHNRTYDTDPDYKNYDKRFGVASQAITTDVSSKISNPNIRKRFVLEKEGRAEQYRNGHLKRATDLEQAHSLKKTEESVQTSMNIYTAPGVGVAEKEHARQDIYTRIEAAEKTGVITPAAATELRNKYGRSLEMGDAQTRAHENPTEMRKEIAEYQKRFAEQHNKAAPIGAVNVGGDGIATIEGIDIKPVINPQAPYMGRKRKVEDVNGFVIHGFRADRPIENMVEYGQKVDEGRGFDPGYHFYIARDGTVIQGAPLNRITNGAKGRNRTQIHVALQGTEADGEATPEQIKVARGLISGLGTKLGISNKSIASHGEIQRDRNPKEGGGVAKMIREEGYTVGNDEFAGLTDPEDIKRAAELRGRYGSLTPQDLAKLDDLAREREKVSLEHDRHKFKSMLADDVASIRAGEGSREGLTPQVMADAKKVLTKNQIETYMADRKVAQHYSKATKDLNTLSNDDLEARRLEYVPKGTVDRALNQKIYDDVKKAINDETKLRSEDPVLAVDNEQNPAPVIEAWRERLAGSAPEGTVIDPSADMEGRVGARLEAQDDLGIDEMNRRSISKMEAEQLLPNLSALPPSERMDALNKAWAAVKQTYGVHAEKVMRDAMDFTRVNSETRDRMMMGSMRSDPVRQRVDVAPVLTEAETGFMEPEGEAVMPRAQAPAPEAAAGPAQPGRYPPATVAAYEFAMSRGAEGAATYDRLFGQGAFARDTSTYHQTISKRRNNDARSMPSQ